jgi:uncharacterized protein (DUF1697 family)
MARAKGSSEPVRYVAFLRGINLGKRRVTMSRLKALFEELGYGDVATFIASGNIVFSSPNDDAVALEAEIAAHLVAALGYDVDTFVRTSGEVIKISSAKFFDKQDEPEMNVHVSFLHEKLTAATANKLAAIRTDADAFRVVGREFYWLRQGRMSDSIVWTLPEAKALKLPSSTMRSMTSIRKLVMKHF